MKNVIDQIFCTVDYEGILKDSLPCVDLHPYAKSVIEKALRREDNFLTKEDFYILLSELKNASNVAIYELFTYISCNFMDEIEFDEEIATIFYKNDLNAARIMDFEKTVDFAVKEGYWKNLEWFDLKVNHIELAFQIWKADAYKGDKADFAAFEKFAKENNFPI